MAARIHKRKAPAFHNHDERPFLSRRITAIGSTSHLSHTAQPLPIPQDIHEAQYTIPLDEDGRYEVELDDSHVFPRIRGNSLTPEVLSGGVPGIKVLPKVKAKRYANSVSSGHFFHFDWVF